MAYKQEDVKTITRAAAVLPATTQTPYFTVVGKVRILQIVGEITTVFDGTANDIKLVANPTVGADVDMCVALTVTSDTLGTIYTITGTLGDALIATPSGAVPEQATGVIVAAGSIDLDATATDTTGATKWTVQYVSLDPGSSVVAA